MSRVNSKRSPLFAALLACACDFAGDHAPADGTDATATDDGAEPPATDDGEPDDEPICHPVLGAKQLALGGNFSCALQHCGEVVCWGTNQFGQLGQGHIEAFGDDELPNALGPIDIGGPTASLAVGRRHACALRLDGELLCWGLSSSGALGHGDLNIIGNNELLSEAGIVDVGHEIRSVHAGPLRTCVITVDHQLVCWGANHSGELGYGHTETIGDDEPASAAGIIDVGGPVVDVALSSGHTCALLDGGDVRCWGIRTAGLGAGYQVGESIGDDEPPSSMPPVALGGPAQALAAGFHHLCALLENGELVCWGDNGEGQLGHGNFDDIGDDETPAAIGPVPLGEPATAIALGLRHSCAIGESGSVYCWGADNDGQLGHPDVMGSIGGELRPVDVGPIALPGAVDALAAGDDHNCAAIGADVHCWGAGSGGRLGYGNEQALGDDEPPASGGPVQFSGGHGNGGVAPIPDEHDDEPDATLTLRWQQPQPPAGLAVGRTIHARGSNWWAFQCEGCDDSMVIRAADDHSVILARINERDQLHPHRGILNMLGLDPVTWLYPLDLQVADLGLCSPLPSPHEGCFGTRLSIDVDVPNSGAARLLDRSRGQAGGGYLVSVGGLQDWSDACVTQDEVSQRSVLAIRRDCAPNCGPIAVIDSCEPPANDLDFAYLSFHVGPKQPRDPGYDVTCEVLGHELDGPQTWRIDLDCVGLP